MGYAYYEIVRNGEKIKAGYSVEAVCERDGCKATIDRGLGHLCGKTPGGDEHGCGGYFCGEHLTYNNQCETCAAVADEAARWIHPETGEEFDLRDHFLPAGSTYDARGSVWKYLGERRDDTPVLQLCQVSSDRPDGPEQLITEGEWEDVGRIVARQINAA
ncbi:hypothetical protein ACWGH2_29180 [Streptomyces sp. NPDC054871]